jgi:hypothetical protein
VHTPRATVWVFGAIATVRTSRRGGRRDRGKPAIARRGRGQAGRSAGSRSGASDPTASAATGRSRHSNRRRSRVGRQLRRPWPHESTAPPAPAPQAAAARHTSAVQHTNAMRNERASPPALRSPAALGRGPTGSVGRALTPGPWGRTKARRSVPRTIGGRPQEWSATARVRYRFHANRKRGHNAGHQAASPAAVVQSGSGGGHVAAARRSGKPRAGYTRYKNVYIADGPAWTQSARQ